jgi:nitrogen-specific signal transduction histidine kinase
MPERRLHIPGSLPPREALEVLINEMNMPLHSIQSYARLLDEVPDDNYREAVRMIMAHADNIRLLLDGVQDYLKRVDRS